MAGYAPNPFFLILSKGSLPTGGLIDFRIFQSIDRANADTQIAIPANRFFYLIRLKLLFT